MARPDRSPRPSGQNHLLRMVEAFLRRTGMGHTGFGRRAVGDTNLVAQLRRGRELRSGTALRVLRYMAEVEGLPKPRRRKSPKGEPGSQAGPPG